MKDLPLFFPVLISKDSDFVKLVMRHGAPSERLAA